MCIGTYRLMFLCEYSDELITVYYKPHWPMYASCFRSVSSQPSVGSSLSTMYAFMEGSAGAAAIYFRPSQVIEEFLRDLAEGAKCDGRFGKAVEDIATVSQK